MTNPAENCNLGESHTAQVEQQVGWAEEGDDA